MKALEIIKQWDNIEFGDSLEQHKRKIDKAIKELEELNNRSCRNCNYCKEVYSYFYPLCVYNENEPFQIHNKQVLKCDFHKAKGE